MSLLPENVIVHALWIGDRLSLMERLTIRLLQENGHQVHLWSYRPIALTPAGVVRRDAAEILPESSIFRYTGTPIEIPNGGIGSLSHWSDRFQMKLLSQVGGIYIQLDVACLQPMNFAEEYVFVPHGRVLTIEVRPVGPHAPGEFLPVPGTEKITPRTAVAAFFMKCPKGASFAEECARDLEQHINGDTIGTLDWECSMRRIDANLSRTLPDCERYFLDPRRFMDLGGATAGPFFEDCRIPEHILMIHWSNATHHPRKDNPIEGSVYESLLRKVGLIA